jgi:hypothetical protein
MIFHAARAQLEKFMNRLHFLLPHGFTRHDVRRPGRAVAVLAASAYLTAQAAGAGDPDFARDVQPILSGHCFHCHGPDEASRKGGLRLDTVEGALAGGDSGDPALVAGNAAASALFQRVLTTDPDEIMPPPKEKKPLAPEQIDILRRWIDGGGTYSRHWSFVPPVRPAPPTDQNAQPAPAHPVDALVQARLARENLSPAPPAPAETLVRRIHLDIVGLPPSPDEVRAFVAADAMNRRDAVAALVDRLLALPAFGEKWARPWLDAARYADSNGYEKDFAREQWAWRDWVIDALNRDMPYDQFIVDQVAGDLRPGAGQDGLIATGFLANGLVNEEGAVVPEQFRTEGMFDRMDALGKSVLGLTLQCAQCHTHKFDPIPHREYYQFMALLDNADEPKFAVPDANLDRRRAEIDAKIDAAWTALPEQFPASDAESASASESEPIDGRRRERLARAFADWVERESSAAVKWTVITPSAMSTTMPYLTQLGDGSVLAAGDHRKSDVYTLRFDERLAGVTAIRIEALPHDSLPAGGPGATSYEGPEGDFFLAELTATLAGKPLKFAAASASFTQKFSPDTCYDGKADTGWSTSSRPGQAHQAVFNFDKPVDLEGAFELQMLFERHYACGLGRFRISVATAEKPAASSHPADIVAILAAPADERSDEDRAKLMRRFLEVTPELAEGRKAIEKLEKSRPRPTTTLILRERPEKHTRQTFVHNRGEFLQPTERVTAGVLGVLHPLPAGAEPDRLALARWLVSPENPLVGRVVMNRQWQAIFGRGLVRTTEDFGYQGELPTHPQLLDWLAVEFIERGWSMKAMHRLIVTSATYRQSSAIRNDLAATDPHNELLARGPRVRLEAELVRDAVLKAAGLLSSRMFGPPVFPPQPTSITTEGAYGKFTWKVSTGEDRHRRGLYTFMKRTAPFAMTLAFDGPSGEACVARRDVSNTPLQALTLLNDEVFVEASQAMGGELAAAAGSIDERLTSAFRRCLARQPDADEIAALREFFERQMQRIEAGELDAKAIAGTDQGDVKQHAAWTLLARVLFNLDEMITKE